MAGQARHRPRRADAAARAIFLSRGMTASFDCSDAKRDLDWHPMADPEHSARDAIAVMPA